MILPSPCIPKMIVIRCGPHALLASVTLKRLQHLHGKFAKHPFVDRRLPIIADNMVEKDFGTGAVKITPAHDPNDYEVGKRHNLEFISILNDDGTLNANAGEKFNVRLTDSHEYRKLTCVYRQGMKRFHARREVVKALTEAGLFIETKDNPMQIPVCR